jgi:hypothetical protein
VIADLIAAPPHVSQRTLERVRRIELELGVEPSHYHYGAGATAPRHDRGEPDLDPPPRKARRTAGRRRWGESPAATRAPARHELAGPRDRRGGGRAACR